MIKSDSFSGRPQLVLLGNTFLRLDMMLPTEECVPFLKKDIENKKNYFPGWIFGQTQSQRGKIWSSLPHAHGKIIRMSNNNLQWGWWIKILDNIAFLAILNWLDVGVLVTAGNHQRCSSHLHSLLRKKSPKLNPSLPQKGYNTNLLSAKPKKWCHGTPKPIYTQAFSISTKNCGNKGEAQRRMTDNTKR